MFSDQKQFLSSSCDPLPRRSCLEYSHLKTPPNLNLAPLIQQGKQDMRGQSDKRELNKYQTCGKWGRWSGEKKRMSRSRRGGEWEHEPQNTITQGWQWLKSVEISVLQERQMNKFGLITTSKDLSLKRREDVKRQPDITTAQNIIAPLLPAEYKLHSLHFC